MDNIYSNYQEVVHEMQRLTELNTPFSFSFVKSNGSMRVVNKALLRKQTPSSKDSKGQHKLNYIDVTEDTHGNCYIPLLCSLNNKNIVIQ
jgi:hypothetical protein